MTKRNFTPFLLLFVFLFTGCTPQGAVSPPPVPTPAATAAIAPVQTPPPPAETPPAPTPDPLETQVAEQLAAMTAAEKVGQLVIAGFDSTRVDDQVQRLLQFHQVGGLIFYGRNIQSADQLTQLTNDLKAANQDGIPLFLATDQEGGLCDRMPPEIRRTPGAWEVGQSGDPQAGTRLGAALAAECAAFGFNTDFAPVLDIWSNPENTVIGQRSFGADAETAAAFGPAAAQAMAQGGVIPVAKHFPGHGDTAVDSHVGLPVVEKSRSELEELELVPFRAAIQDGDLPAVMVAHISLTQLDPDLPASLSPAVITGLLREELGFDGVVFTDDLTMGAVTQDRTIGEAAVLAIEAGCDVVLACHGRASVEETLAALLQAVESGRISQERLDQSLKRILTLKARYGLTNDPIPPADLAALNQQIDLILPADPAAS